MLTAMLGVVAAFQLSADTFVPASITTTTWTKAENRYIVPANSSVEVGHTLTIEPGVEVLMGPEVYIHVEGRIQALGTATDPIRFRAASLSAPWRYIWIPDHGTAASSKVRWCEFSNAAYPLWLDAYGGEIETQEVSNCVFQDCGTGILGWSTGESTLNSLDPLIQNCRFVNCSTNGILFVLRRRGGPGAASPVIRGNTFLDTGDTAIAFTVESGRLGRPQVINNTIMNAQVGISTGAPYDVTAKNNLFVSCVSAMHRSTVDNLNLTINYNNFHNNDTNFFNYPANHGSIIWDNANGDPADIYFNIFENPRIADAETLTLEDNSPCIDAGDGTGPYLDGCFPPSQGTTINDIGAYGGPSACGWVDTTLTVFNLQLEPCFGVTINPISPGLYRLEYAPTVGNTNLWVQITNVNLVSTPWTYVDQAAPEGHRVYRGVLVE